jgi:SNF2 family DNA or RNA helicase
MNDSINFVEQPKNLNISLFSHQLASIYNMEKLETERFVYDGENKIYTDIGINSDLSGYGKTLSIVGLVCRDKMNWDLNTYYTFSNIYTFGNQHCQKILNENYSKCNCTLVLTGNSLLHQWEKEFNNTNLKVFSITTKKKALNIEIYDYDVILIIPSMFNILLNKYNYIAFKRFIYDEPTTVKVPAMKPIKFGFMWLVTATPSNLYTIHKKLNKNYVSNIIGERSFESQIRPYITIKNDDDFVRQSFAMPPTENLYHNYKDNLYKTVYGLVDEKIMLMIEAGYIEGVVDVLGGKKTDNIIELIKQNKNFELEEIKSKIKIWNLRGNEEKVKYWESRHSRILDQINDISSRYSELLKNNCSICHDQYKKPIMEYECQNIFCGECILTWLAKNSTCPLCRKVVESSKLVYIETENKNEEKVCDDKSFSKNEIIVNLIKNNSRKFIIFSAYEESFSGIRRILKENNITFKELKGSCTNRKNNIEKFKFGNVQVFFLNSNYDSCGINLQETDDIILYHKMSEQDETQIIGRANRIGRTKPLKIHRFVSINY